MLPVMEASSFTPSVYSVHALTLLAEVKHLFYNCCLSGHQVDYFHRSSPLCLQLLSLIFTSDGSQALRRRPAVHRGHFHTYSDLLLFKSWWVCKLEVVHFVFTTNHVTLLTPYWSDVSGLEPRWRSCVVAAVQLVSWCSYVDTIY